MRYLIMQGPFPLMSSLPARDTREEAQQECDRMNAVVEHRKKENNPWDGASRESCWVKEIE